MRKRNRPFDLTVPLIKFTSSQAPNAYSAAKAILAALSQRTKIHIEWQSNKNWRLREKDFDNGKIDMAWVCGLPYVRKADNPDIDVELLAAPIMAGQRYQEKPIYYSDVIVSSKSTLKRFGDLKNHSWAINEPDSHSGYNITRYHLAKIGENADFFSRVDKAGAHQNAIRRVINGESDAAAIDSTVLEAELDQFPKFRKKIRVIDSLGPSPIPPWLIHKSVTVDIRKRIREALLNLHNDANGRTILSKGNYARFAKVSDQDYDEIRHMERKANTIKLL